MGSSTEKHLHIVAFDVPFPPNYGGVIDIFYKVKALHNLGIRIHLHCFEYGRKLQAELTKYCFTLKSYPRKLNLHYLFSDTPYIIKSRESELLVSNLRKDNHPILFEGAHTCFHLNDFRLAHRKKYVRMHNIEHDYYKGLASAEKAFFKRHYFKSEAGKLKKFESQYTGASGIMAISPADTEYLSDKFTNVWHIPAFHEFTDIESKTGKGEYALYHGNLSVSENNHAALFLVKEIFNDLPYQLIIAGNHPTKELANAVNKTSNVTLFPISDNKKIAELIEDAQVNILPTFQPTGIKLKLLHALYKGRWCIVNEQMVKNTGLEKLCIQADSTGDMKNAVNSIFDTSFSNPEIKERSDLLTANYSNEKTAKEIISKIFGEKI